MSTLRASAADGLAPRSAAQILADLHDAHPSQASGTVVEHADLGLPVLPSGVGGDGSSDFSSLINGAHTMRVWYSGPQLARVALIGALGESDVVHNGQDLWVWSSTDNTAIHAHLPAPSAMTSRHPSGLPSGLPGALASTLPLTPLDVANAIIALLDPTTSVTSDGTVTVAGRAAYELVIAPRDPASLIGSVRIAMDASQHIPLRVQIYAAGATKTAFEIGFTKVSFDRPDPSVFSFNPPPGATVKQASPGVKTTKPSPAPPAKATLTPPRVIGSGWTAVLSASIPVGATTSGDRNGGSLGALLRALPTVNGAFGHGKLVQTALFSALITDGGRVYVGAVDGAHLMAAASTAGK
jgi:outer membrane lipoprotein-sorting protein